jgi:hypothetical protein
MSTKRKTAPGEPPATFPRARTKCTAKRRAAVVENFRKCGRVDLACDQAGVERSSHYHWLKKHPDYAAAFEAARPQVAGMIEAELHRRAIEGVLEPVYNGGKRAVDFVLGADGQPQRDAAGKVMEFPASIRKYSDACLLAMAEARVEGYNKRRYDHRFVDETGKDRTLDLAAVRAYMNSIPDGE